MNFKKYHVSRNLWTVYPNQTYRGVTFEFTNNTIKMNNTCTQEGNIGDTISLKAGTYTIAANANINISQNTHILQIYKANVVSETISLSDMISGKATFAIAEDTTDILIRIHVMNGVDYSGLEIRPMLNTGSSPLPYEPYSSEVWHDTPHYIHNTSTDTITTLPAVVYPNDTTATVGLKGNMYQASGVSPDNPIQPQGTGERTGNLADLYNANASQVGLTFSATDNMRIVINGTKTNGANVVSIKRPKIILPAGTYTVKIKMTSGSITGLTSDGVFFGINASTYSQRTTPGVTQIGEVGTRTFTLSEDTTITSFDITPSYGSSGAVFDNATFECLFYAGSDDKPYEPYGFEISISSASTTTPIYLGEVQTTRKIIKLVLTGEENWEQVTAGDNTYIRLDIGVLNTYIGDTIVCTHCGYANISSSTSGYGCDIINSVGSNRDFLCFRLQGYQGNTIFKQYLEAQYAAGTPVCVWYVLAEPTTGIVNEPLRKIGDYADTVSGISIPVTAGGDTLSVDTTLQPSEVTVNYKGWHPVADVHERDNGAWT